MAYLTQIVSLPFWAIVVLILSASLVAAVPPRLTILALAFVVWWSVCLPPRVAWWLLKAMFRAPSTPVQPTAEQR